MQNQSTPARTAAKYGSKCSLIFRQAPILAILMLCAVFCQAQVKKKLNIASDTLGLLKYIYLDKTYAPFTTDLGSSFKFVTASDYYSMSRCDTVKVVMLIADTAHNFRTYVKIRPCGDSVKNNFIQCGEEVKEDKGNYGMGQTYWRNGYSILKINEWEAHYLDDKKQPLSPTVIVWMSVSVK